MSDPLSLFVHPLFFSVSLALFFLSTFFTGQSSIAMRSAYTLVFSGLAALASATCEGMCGGGLTFSGNDTSIISCTYYTAGTTFNIEGDQSACTSSATPEVDICRIVMNVATSENSDTYIEVWMPSGTDSAWNGRVMTTDNGGVGGCEFSRDLRWDVNSFTY